MHYEKFMKIVERSAPDRIEAMISTHVRVAKKQSPKSTDAIQVLRFANFLSSGICPQKSTEREMGFYQRTAKRLVQANIWPENALDQFP